MIPKLTTPYAAVFIASLMLALCLPRVCVADGSRSATAGVSGTVSVVKGLQTFPLAGARLKLTRIPDDGSEHEATTDSTGRYTVDLPPGTYKMLLAWMGGDCSEINRASFRLDAGTHLTFDFLVMQCPISDPIIRRGPIEGDATKAAEPQRTNPLNVPLTAQTEKYQEELIPAERNRWPEIVVSFGKYDNQADEIRYFPLHQKVMNPFAIPNPPVPLSLPVTITVDRYTLRASSVILEKEKMVFKASGQVLLSDGEHTTNALSARLFFSNGEPKVEIDH